MLFSWSSLSLVLPQDTCWGNKTNSHFEFLSSFQKSSPYTPLLVYNNNTMRHHTSLHNHAAKEALSSKNGGEMKPIRINATI